MSKPGVGPETRALRLPRPRLGWRRWAACLLPAVLACTFAGAGQAQTVYRGGLDEAVGKLVHTLVEGAKLRDKRVLVKSDDFFELGTELRLEMSEVLSRMSVTELTRGGVSVAMPGSDEDAVRVLHGRWRRESDEDLYLELFVAAPVESGDPTALRSAKGLVPIDESIRKAIEATPDDWGRLLVLRLERGVRDRKGRTVHLQPIAVEAGGSRGGRLEGFLANWLGRALVNARLFELVEPPPGVEVKTEGELYVTATVHEGHVEVGLRVLDDRYRRVAFATVGLKRDLFPPGMFGPGVRAELARCAGLVESGRWQEAKGCYEGVRRDAPGNTAAVEGVRAGLERIADLERARDRRARVEALVGEVEAATERSKFVEARKWLEELRKLEADHARLEELAEEIDRAEQEKREAELRAEEEQLKREEEERRRVEAERLKREAANPRNLLRAARDGDYRKVEALLGAGADIDARDANGETPLHKAAWEGELEVVRLLIDQGADIDARDKGGETPLHEAAWEGALEVVRLLIAQGADIDARDEDGDTPLDIAELTDEDRVAALLRRRGGSGGDEEDAAGICRYGLWWCYMAVQAPTGTPCFCPATMMRQGFTGVASPQ